MQILSDIMQLFFLVKRVWNSAFHNALNKINPLFVNYSKTGLFRRLCLLLEPGLAVDALHFICPQFVAIFQEEALSKWFTISCDWQQLQGLYKKLLQINIILYNSCEYMF